MHRKTLALILFAFGFTTPAVAVVKVATYTGTIYNSYDTSGLFGLANSSLDGLTYVAEYAYDTNMGGRTTVPAVSDELYGGDGYGSLTPMLSASITINGISRCILTQNYYGYVYVATNIVEHVAYDYTLGTTGNTDNYLLNTADLVGATPSLDTDVHTKVGVSGFGYFRLSSSDSNGIQTTYTYGAFSYDNVSTVAVNDGVAEPATWALMIGGFGMTGFATRRRQRMIAA